jgi:hypothetical protein
VRGGRCETCQGDGILRIEMHFLPDVYVECEACGGRRYNRETLEVKYRQASIADVLDMTVSQAASFLENIPKLRQKLETIREVGLGYIRLGQSATTLSGGEAQRIKLSKELAKKSTGRTVYVLDEPTTGLHFADIAQLLEVLNRLVEAGNTVIVIEHNLDVIKTADWVIDLGPRAGRAAAASSPRARPKTWPRWRPATPASTSSGCCRARRPRPATAGTSILQHAPQPAARPHQPGAHRRQRHPVDPGDLPVAHPARVQFERPPQPLIQPGDRPAQKLRLQVQPPGRQLGGRLGRQVIGQRFLAPAHARPVDERVAQDGLQPGAHAGAHREQLAVAQRLAQRVLHQVVGVGP